MNYFALKTEGDSGLEYIKTYQESEQAAIDSFCISRLAPVSAILGIVQVSKKQYDMGPKTAYIRATRSREKKLVYYEIKKTETDFIQEKIRNSSDSYKVIRKFYLDDIHVYESVFILCLNNQNITQGYAKISQGGIVGTVVDIRIIAKYAVENLSKSIIIAHNHPSGLLKASEDDIRITKKLKIALKTLDIELLDHLIITDTAYYSFGDEGIL